MPVALLLRLAIPAALLAIGAIFGYVACYRWSVEPLKATLAGIEAVGRDHAERNLSLTLKAQNDQLVNQKEVAALRADSARAWAAVRVRAQRHGTGAVPDVHADDPVERPSPDGSEGSCTPAAEPAIAAAVSTLMADDALELDLLACRRDLRACAGLSR